MEKHGYDTHLVGVSANPTAFTEEAIMHFNELNKDGIQKMNDNLQKENPSRVPSEGTQLFTNAP
jgi:hypothetical protein